MSSRSLSACRGTQIVFSSFHLESNLSRMLISRIINSREASNKSVLCARCYPVQPTKQLVSNELSVGELTPSSSQKDGPLSRFIFPICWEDTFSGVGRLVVKKCIS